MTSFKATDAELCTLKKKNSYDGTWKAELWHTPSTSIIPSGMGIPGVFNALIEKASATVFPYSSAGQDALR